MTGLMRKSGWGASSLRADVHHHEALHDADLHARESDARRVVHGLDHVVERRPDGTVDLGHRSGRLTQQAIGQREDGADGHGGL